MAHHLLQVVRVNGVQDVEEVLARRAFANGVLIGEVLRELWVFTELRPQALDRELIVVWNRDLLHLHLLQQMLLAGQNVFEEILIDDVLIR